MVQGELAGYRGTRTTCPRGGDSWEPAGRGRGASDGDMGEEVGGAYGRGGR